VTPAIASDVHCYIRAALNIQRAATHASCSSSLVRLQVLHGCIANDALIVDLPEFCREVVIGTRQWLGEVEGTPRFEANYAKFAKRHPSGLAPYIGGVAVVG
jgi:hypothetical protein